LIGHCSLTHLDWIARSAEFSIYIGPPEYSGKGLATETLQILFKYGFNTINLNKIWGETFDFNHAAIHLYQKLGFIQEGQLRQHRYDEGRYFDAFIFGLLKSDWNDHQS